MRTILRPAIVSLILFTILCGILYPFLVTGIAQLAFPRQANGSLIQTGNRLAGSTLIGQPFTDPRYFWGRPSATVPPYNAAASSGSNLGPTNPILLEAVKARIAAFRAADPDNHEPIPADLVTASGSGLDPHITPAAAEYQVPRVARLRGISEEAVRALVARFTEGPDLDFLGESRVNVLLLNLALDGLP
ncbi:MAG: potassium-transporting ATPase subunit KdpC [bacterium]